ncbi:N-acetylglucosaminyl-diphospho-decaprenol L-rhamnosyltransferase [Undibacterium sp. GrIS 1.8]|uniref:glycosyltransferase n=1 Tax=Undibacterium sp. GrIS 1.8 TaxID=3143934 RepID=UPI00339ACCA5
MQEHMIHVAIISHGHEKLLIASQLGGLLHSAHSDDGIKVWIKDNRPSAELQIYCSHYGISYTDSKPNLGFGENNNFLFKKVSAEFGIQPGDYFIVMNPDLSTTPETIRALVTQMKKDDCVIASINLFKDAEHKLTDANIRHFPTYKSLLKIMMAKSLTQHYDKNSIMQASYVDWASGAFLAFDAAHYNQLDGFNQAYFMYFEDVDICYRSQKIVGKGVLYYPQFKAIHLAAHKNRQLISKHAYWFIYSFLKFLSRRYFVYSRQKPVASLPLAK